MKDIRDDDEGVVKDGVGAIFGRLERGRQPNAKSQPKPQQQPKRDHPKEKIHGPRACRVSGDGGHGMKKYRTERAQRSEKETQNNTTEKTTQTHTQTLTHTNTYTHTQTHTYTHKHIHTYIHTNTYIHTYTYTNIYIIICIHKHTNIFMYISYTVTTPKI